MMAARMSMASTVYCRATSLADDLRAAAWIPGCLQKPSHHRLPLVLATDGSSVTEFICIIARWLHRFIVNVRLARLGLRRKGGCSGQGEISWTATRHSCGRYLPVPRH